MGPSRAKPGCGRWVVRGGEPLALVLPVLRFDSKTFRRCLKSGFHQSVIGIRVPLASKLFIGSFTLNISTSLVVWTFSAVKWVLDEALGLPSPRQT